MSEPNPATTDEPTPAAADPRSDDPAAGAPPAEKSGRDRTGKDMLLALACLLVPILAIGALLRACGSSDPSVVDPASAIDDARAAAVFPLLAPQDLHDGWRPVQAAFRRSDEGAVGTLRLGYLTPSGGQLLLVESNEDGPTLLERELGDPVESDGVLEIDNRIWARSIVRGAERSIVNVEAVEPGGLRVIIIVGHAPIEEMTALADALR